MPAKAGVQDGHQGRRPGSVSSHGSQHQHGLPMNPLPMLQAGRGASVTSSYTGKDWGQAAGNLEDAKLAIQALHELLEDAVFLDEESYTRAAEASAYQNKIQALVKRIREMELSMAAVEAEVVAKDQALAAATARNKELTDKVTDLQQELENNTVVFKVHYQELELRNEEILRLNRVVADLQQQHTDLQEQLGAGQTSSMQQQPVLHSLDPQTSNVQPVPAQLLSQTQPTVHARTHNIPQQTTSSLPTSTSTSQPLPHTAQTESSKLVPAEETANLHPDPNEMLIHGNPPEQEPLEFAAWDEKDLI